MATTRKPENYDLPPETPKAKTGGGIFGLGGRPAKDPFAGPLSMQQKRAFSDIINHATIIKVLAGPPLESPEGLIGRFLMAGVFDTLAPLAEAGEGDRKSIAIKCAPAAVTLRGNLGGWQAELAAASDTADPQITETLASLLEAWDVLFPQKSGLGWCIPG